MAVMLRKLLLGIVVFAAGLALFLLGRDVLFDRDRIGIEIERSRRFARAAVGTPLHGTPDLNNLSSRLEAQNLALGAPIFIRIFKLEFELELWMKRGDRFHHFATYPICRWSGLLGPKLQEGDGQAPEGFYTVDVKALNPASRWHRSFNLGFPNAFDRAHHRTGSLIMVHGGCASIGCFAMTDAVIDELWKLVTAALKHGQPRFHVHVFPFRMTHEELRQRGHTPWVAFWQDLKLGHDLFEATGTPPMVSVCQGRYIFASSSPGSDGSRQIEARCADSTGAKS